MRERYEHPLEVEAYSKQVEMGLLAEEAAIIERYFPSPTHLLNLGCGAGREGIALAKSGHRVTGVDISREMIQRARINSRKYGLKDSDQLNWIWLKDPLQLPFPDGTFDGALALAQLLSHLPDQEVRIAFLSEVRRVLTPKGVFVATITDRTKAADLFDEDENNNDESTDDPDHDELGGLTQLAGWEEGDILAIRPSEADIDEPLFFHLHTYDEIQIELKEAGLKLVTMLEASQLTAAPAPDAHRYPFIVAKPSTLRY